MQTHLVERLIGLLPVRVELVGVVLQATGIESSTKYLLVHESTPPGAKRWKGAHFETDSQGLHLVVKRLVIERVTTLDRSLGSHVCLQHAAAKMKSGILFPCQDGCARQQEKCLRVCKVVLLDR